MRNNVLLCALGGLLIGLGPPLAGASTLPNHYECEGKQVKLIVAIGNSSSPGTVGYGTSGSFIKLNLGKASYSFDEFGMTTESTALGDIMEVELEAKPEVNYKKLASVLIPTIFMDILTTEADFKSQLIVTTVGTPLGMLSEGVINPSSFVDLNCNATTIY